MPSEIKYPYNCLMLQFKFPDWLTFNKSIVHEEELYNEDGFGREDEPHVTLLYGLHEEITIKEVKPYLYPLNVYTVSINKIDFFESEKYDVVKFNVVGNTLHQTNAKLSKNLPNTNDYSEYHPHMTIAYVQQGTGGQYAKSLDEPIVMKPYSFKYSYTNGTKDYFKI